MMGKDELKSLTHLIEVDGLVPASCLHQKLVRQDPIIRAILVVVEGDAASLPVLVKGLLETCRQPKQSRLVRFLPNYPFFLRDTFTKPSLHNNTIQHNEQNNATLQPNPSPIISLINLM